MTDHEDEEARVVRFNGLGRADDQTIVTGSVLLLVQGGNVEVVRVQLLPENDYGPELTHASNQASLRDDAVNAIRRHNPELLASDRAWTLTCPVSLAKRAQFKS